MRANWFSEYPFHDARAFPPRGIRKMGQTADDDRGALFKKEVSAHMDALYGTALRLTRNPADAEDLVADAVIKAWAALDNLKDTARFKAWIFRILTNAFISDYRKRAGAPDIESFDDTEDGDENFSLFEKLNQPFLLWWNNPEQEFVTKMLREDITGAIDNLSEEFRTVVLLVDVEGFSYREAAEITDVPINTVRTRLKRARGQLQRALWTQAQEAGVAAPEQMKAGPE